jgi:hypothetical protein
LLLAKTGNSYFARTSSQLGEMIGFLTQLTANLATNAYLPIPELKLNKDSTAICNSFHVQAMNVKA